MQFLIFAFLALAASAENYHSYYNPYSYGHGYGHSYGYPSYYSGLGYSGLGYSGLGYSGLYGHNYGLGAGKLSYALGGHGAYAYAPAKPCPVPLLYGSEPLLNRFETVGGPGRISFTLGASRQSSLGTKQGIHNSGKSAITKLVCVQSSITGTFEESQRGPSTKGPGSHVPFVLGSSAGIHSQEKRPILSSSGKLPSPAFSKIAPGAGGKGTSPGRITFTQDFSKRSGDSPDKFVAPAFPQDTNHAVPRPENIFTSQRNLHSNYFVISPPQISQQGVRDFPVSSSVSKLDSIRSIQPNFPAFPTRGHSAGRSRDTVGGQAAKPFSGKLDQDTKSLGLSYSSVHSDENLPVFVAIPGDDSDDGSSRDASDVKPTNKESDNKESFIESISFDTSTKDKSSGEHSSDAGVVDTPGSESPSLYKHSSVGEKVGQKDAIHKQSAKDDNSGYKAPVFVALPEESLTGDKSFKLGGSHATDQSSVFKFSPVGPSYDTGSRVKTSRGQPSFVFGQSYHHGKASSPTVKSFSSRTYETRAYIPEFSPLSGFVDDIGPITLVIPFSPYNYDGVDIQKK